MAGAFIDLQAMQSLVQCMDGAAEDLRGIKGELVSILGGVDLDTSPPTPLETAAAWVSDQVPGLRRRLAMAQHIQGSNPKFGEGTPIPIDESKLSTLTPAQARQKAQAAAIALKNADGKPSAAVMKEIKDNQDDPYYASAFAKQFSPDEIATVVKQLNQGFPGDHRADMDPTDDQKKWIATYKSQLHTLADVFGTATRTTSPDLKMPADWTRKWSDVITGKPTTNDDGTNTYGHSLALSLLLKNGTYGTDFITKIADDAYDYERREGKDGDPVWSPKSDDSVWDPDMGDHAPPNRDVMANILKGLGHNPLAAQEFFNGDESESTTIHGKQVTVDSKLKYFINDRLWTPPDVLSDDGDGLGDAIRAASTYYRDRGFLGTQSATIASQTMALIAAHDGYGKHGFSLIHGSATSGWHMPGAMQSDIADVMADYVPDLYRAYGNSNATGVNPPPWSTTSNSQGLPGDPFGMAVSRGDLDTIMKTLGGNEDNFAKVTTSVLAYNQYQVNHVMGFMTDADKARVLAGGVDNRLKVMLNGPSVLSNVIKSAYDGAKNEEEIKNANTEAMNKFLDVAGSFPVLDVAKVENPIAGWAFDTIKDAALDHLKGEPVADADRLWSDNANSMSDKLTNNFQNLMLKNGFYDPKVIAKIKEMQGPTKSTTGLPDLKGGKSPAVNYDSQGRPTGFNYSSDAYQAWSTGVYDPATPTNGTMPDGGLPQEVKNAYVTDYGVSF